MPVQPQEILDQLAKAAAEAKATIRELHEARQAALDVDRKNRERITTLIVEEVTRQVGELAADAEQQLRAGVAKTIDDLTGELQRRLLGPAA